MNTTTQLFSILLRPQVPGTPTSRFISGSLPREEPGQAQLPDSLHRHDEDLAPEVVGEEGLLAGVAAGLMVFIVRRGFSSIRMISLDNPQIASILFDFHMLVQYVFTFANGEKSPAKYKTTAGLTRLATAARHSAEALDRELGQLPDLIIKL